jgi:hypothetical protein
VTTDPVVDGDISPTRTSINFLPSPIYVTELLEIQGTELRKKLRKRQKEK